MPAMGGTEFKTIYFAKGIQEAFRNGICSQTIRLERTESTKEKARFSFSGISSRRDG